MEQGPPLEVHSSPGKKRDLVYSPNVMKGEVPLPC
jgi:hypothetical protein